MCDQQNYFSCFSSCSENMQKVSTGEKTTNPEYVFSCEHPGATALIYLCSSKSSQTSPAINLSGEKEKLKVQLMLGLVAKRDFTPFPRHLT